MFFLPRTCFALYVFLGLMLNEYPCDAMGDFFLFLFLVWGCGLAQTLPTFIFAALADSEHLKDLEDHLPCLTEL